MPPIDPQTGVSMPTPHATLGAALEGFQQLAEKEGAVTHLALVAWVVLPGGHGHWRFQVIGPMTAEVDELVTFCRGAAEVLTERADTLATLPTPTCQ